MTLEATRKVLLVCCEDSACALPLDGVIEIMRALPLEPLESAPEFVLGVSLIRGAFVPVVDLAALVLGARGRSLQRYVSVSSGGRHVALAVSQVLGTREVSERDFAALPELLRGSESPFVAGLGRLDAKLLRLLREARVWSEAIGALSLPSGAPPNA